MKILPKFLFPFSPNYIAPTLSIPSLILDSFLFFRCDKAAMFCKLTMNLWNKIKTYEKVDYKKSTQLLGFVLVLPPIYTIFAGVLETYNLLLVCRIFTISYTASKLGDKFLKLSAKIETPLFIRNKSNNQKIQTSWGRGVKEITYFFFGDALHTVNVFFITRPDDLAR